MRCFYASCAAVFELELESFIQSPPSSERVGVGVGVLLFNHHLHRGHQSASADPAGCSANGALHATCKD
jgi:hypothetical protein